MVPPTASQSLYGNVGGLERRYVNQILAIVFSVLLFISLVSLVGDVAWRMPVVN